MGEETLRQFSYGPNRYTFFIDGHDGKLFLVVTVANSDGEMLTEEVHPCESHPAKSWLMFESLLDATALPPPTWLAARPKSELMERLSR